MRIIKCAHCSIEFEADDSEEEAIKEYKKNFPSESRLNIELDMVCDDCYNEFMKWHNEGQTEIDREELFNDLLKEHSKTSEN